MRKLFCMVLVCVLAIVTSGCGQTDEKEPIPEEGTTDGSESMSSQAGDVFSDTSSSEGAAESLASISAEEHGNPFNFEAKTVMLNSGYEMPIYGLGTYSLTDAVCVESVTAALDRGVRLIDTAYMYHNDVICCEV